MKFNPRAFVKTGIQKKNPVQRIDRWNPQPSEKPISVTNARVEPNYTSTVDPMRNITRKPRG